MNTQIIPLVEQAVVDRLKSKACFTALDISNALKSAHYAVTHGEVATIVRDIYQTGAMDFYDYDRRLIDVSTDGGTKKAQAFLYLHNNTKERDYTLRQQNSLPRVAPDTARDPAGSIPCGPIAILPRASRAKRTHSTQDRRKHRRDGALAIPQALVSRLGWTVGMSLGLTVDAETVRLTSGGDIPVQVWDGQRVRICKRKLRLCGLLKLDSLSLKLDGSTLSIVTKEN